MESLPRRPTKLSAAYDKLGGKIAVVKSQIHAGGRGQGNRQGQSGPKGRRRLQECRRSSRRRPTGLLGKTLVTIQTGPEGKTVNQVFVEAGCDIARELYLGIVLDRAAAKPVLMASTEGGVEIEKVAEETPELIFKEHFDPRDRLGAVSGSQALQETGDQRRGGEGGGQVHAGRFAASMSTMIAR